MRSKDKCVCVCGGKYLVKNKKQHDKTKKHLLFEIANTIQDRTIGETLKQIQQKINK